MNKKKILITGSSGLVGPLSEMVSTLNMKLLVLIKETKKAKQIMQ